MTDIEQRAAQVLHRIRYAPNIWHEPRAKTLYRLSVYCPSWKLTALEQADLWFLIWHYRRQVKDAALIVCADDVVNHQVALRF